jgi:hypothetical protein
MCFPGLVLFVQKRCGHPEHDAHMPTHSMVDVLCLHLRCITRASARSIINKLLVLVLRRSVDYFEFAVHRGDRRTHPPHQRTRHRS